LKTDLAEAMARVPEQRAEARTILEELAKRDLIASPEGYAALASWRSQSGRQRRPEVAMKRCEAMAKSPDACIIAVDARLGVQRANIDDEPGLAHADGNRRRTGLLLAAACKAPERGLADPRKPSRAPRAFKLPVAALPSLPAFEAGNVERGKALVAEFECNRCHAVRASPRPSSSATASVVTSKSRPTSSRRPRTRS